MMNVISAKVAHLYQNDSLYYKYDTTNKRRNLNTLIRVYFDGPSNNPDKVKFICWDGARVGLPKNLELSQDQVLFVHARQRDTEEERGGSGEQLSIFGDDSKASPRKVKRGLSVATKNAKSENA